MPTTVMTNPVVWEVPATAAPSTRALLREPFPEAVRGLTFTPAAPGLWRVTRADGLVLGHIERRAGSERDRVRRMRGGTLRSPPGGGFRVAARARRCFTITTRDPRQPSTALAWP